MDLLLYSPKTSARLDYICRTIFTEWYGIAYTITQDEVAFQASSLPRLQYSAQRILPTTPWIQAQDFLFRTDTHPIEPSVVITSAGGPFIFASTADDSWGADILAMSFYFLSRYEEYQPYPADAHHRFPASASLAARGNFLHLPIIDQWVQRLVQDLQTLYPTLIVRPPSFQVRLTYDIDQAWAYRHRSWRGYAGAVRDLVQGRWFALRQRLDVWRRPTHDPFYTFAQLDALHKKYHLSPIYFWLLADPGPFDRNPSYRIPALQNLIRHIAAHYPIGLHPSYRSNTDSAVLKMELKRLENITQQPVTHSRQHFLRLHLPHTYRRLLAVGIRHDYSMGFADQVGFRAGTSRSFRWYDLEREESTSLYIHPFCAMDVSLRTYQQLPPAEAEAQLVQLLHQVWQVQGMFCLLWHNSSFSATHGWASWWALYERVIARAADLRLGPLSINSTD